MKMHYDALAGRTDIGFATENDAGTELTARTTTGVTETRPGRYTVDVAAGTTVVWFEGTVYSTSERAPDDGFGADTCTLVIQSGTTLLDGARVSVSTDSAGTVRCKERSTNSLGRVPFKLVNGAAYFAWIYHADYTGTNPTAFTAVKD